MQFIRKNLKPILLVIVIFFVISIFYGLGQYRSSGNRSQNTGNLIAEVNNIGISYQQWQNAFSSFISRYDNQTLSSMTDETLASIKNNVTEQLINSTLLYQHAKSENIKVTDNEIDNEFNKIRDSFDSEEAFNEALRRNNLTSNQLRDSLRRQLEIDKVIQQEYDNIEITEEELQDFYVENQEYFFQPEKRKVRHILLDDYEEAEKTLNQLKDGIADFEKLAREKSIGPSAEDGGDLGYITKGQMVEEFEEAAFSLDVGEISEIVQTEYGYHILICDDIQEEHQLTYEEAKENIENILKSQKQNEKINELINTLRNDADILIHYDFTSELESQEQEKTQEISAEDDDVKKDRNVQEDSEIISEDSEDND